MKIGIDVDGVMLNLHAFKLKKGLEVFGSDKLVNSNASELTDMFDITKDEENNFWLKYIWEYCRDVKPNPYVVEVINKLRNEGNTIHIVTSRVHTTRNDVLGMIFRKMLKTWFNNNNISYDSINYCHEENSGMEKANICRKLGLDAMIDDEIENCDSVKEYCKTFCYNSPDNYGYDFNNVTRVDDFVDFYNEISKMKQFSARKSNYCTDKTRSRYKLSRNVLGPLFMSLYKPRVIGSDLIPKNKSIIFAGNHLHVNDQYPVLCVFDGVVHCLGKIEYNKGIFGKFCRDTGIIFVDRNTKEGRAKSFDDAVDCLKNGDSLCLFPEGTRNQYTNVLLKIEEIEKLIYWINGHYECGNISFDEVNKLNVYLNEQLRIARNNLIYAKRIVESHNISVIEDELLLPFKTGAVRMAMETDSVIVPFAVNGNYKIGGDNLILRFGEPFNPMEDAINDTNLLRNKIMDLERKNLVNIRDLEGTRCLNSRYVKKKIKALNVDSFNK